MKTFIVIDQGKLRRAETVNMIKDCFGLLVFFAVLAAVMIVLSYSLGRAVYGNHEPVVTQADREFCAGPNLNETFCHAKGLR